MKKIFLIALVLSLVFTVLATGEALSERSATDFYFCMPDEEGEKKVVIKACKDSGYLGIHMENLTKDIIEDFNYPKKKGVIITAVIENSPADEVGLKEYDILYLFDGKEIGGAAQLSRMVRKRKPGDKVEIVAYRDGEKKVKTVELGERKDLVSEFDLEGEFRMEDWKVYAEDMGEYAKELGRSTRLFATEVYNIKGRMGLCVMELDEDLAGYFKVKEDEGVLVLDVSEDSPAEKAGIKSGDVIVDVDGKVISETEDLVDEFAELEDADVVEVSVVRKGKKEKVKLEVEESYFGRTKLFRIPGRGMRFDKWIGTKHSGEGMKGIYGVPNKEMRVEKKKLLREELDVLKEQMEKLKERLEELEEK